jgi:hypothetical protein
MATPEENSWLIARAKPREVPPKIGVVEGALRPLDCIVGYSEQKINPPPSA